MTAVERIVSGGQTGVDQAALQVAIDLGIDHGGWCPKGRRCENGAIPHQFQLQETESARYAVRTEQNVIDSDATLILFRTVLRGGTSLTRQLTQKHKRPCHIANLECSENGGPGAGDALITGVRQWLVQNQYRSLNVAGPRESGEPGIYQDAYRFLLAVFRDEVVAVQ